MAFSYRQFVVIARIELKYMDILISVVILPNVVVPCRIAMYETLVINIIGVWKYRISSQELRVLTMIEVCRIVGTSRE